LLLVPGFTKAGFALAWRPKPEPSSPQAFTVKRTASFFKLEWKNCATQQLVFFQLGNIQSGFASFYFIRR